MRIFRCSVTLIMRSAVITFVICVFEVSLVYYVNAKSNLISQFVLSIPCAAIVSI